MLRITQSEEEKDQALRFLHDVYVEEGLMDRHASGLRITAYHLLPTTQISIASQEKTIIATASLIGRGTLGLPIDKIYDVTKLNNCVEISCLAVHPDFRGGNIFPSLVDFLIKEASKNFEYAVIAVHPRALGFYRSLCFELLREGIVSCPMVNGAPAVGLYAQLSLLLSKLT